MVSRDFADADGFELREAGEAAGAPHATGGGEGMRDRARAAEGGIHDDAVCGVEGVEDEGKRVGDGATRGDELTLNIVLHKSIRMTKKIDV